METDEDIQPDENTQPAREKQSEDRGPSRATPPRGNPDTDQESVDKGEEQLDRVSGN